MVLNNILPKLTGKSIIEINGHQILCPIFWSQFQMFFFNIACHGQIHLNFQRKYHPNHQHGTLVPPLPILSEGSPAMRDNTLPSHCLLVIPPTFYHLPQIQLCTALLIFALLHMCCNYVPPLLHLCCTNVFQAAVALSCTWFAHVF